jgi:hypothetical protein
MNVTEGADWQEENPEDSKALPGTEWLPTGSHDWYRRFQTPIFL